MEENSGLKTRLDGLMQKVQEMERGGDLEALLEGEIAVLKKELYEAALKTREAQAAQEADFPPSGMSGL